MAEEISSSIAAERVAAMLGSAFGLASLGIVGSGVFMLLSHIVAQRQRELGIRMALGASPTNIAGLVLGQVSRILFAGICVG
jgi:putative ABC transport system permease protein